MNGKIAVCYHKEAPIIKNEVLQPILLNAENSEISVFELTDNSGINISKKNKTYCEMTAVYSIWKNDVWDIDYVGLFHYRRILLIEPNLSDNIPKYDYFEINELNKAYDYYGLTKLQIDRLMSEYDMVLPIKTKLEDNVYNHYKNARYHFIEHLDFGIEYILNHYPNYRFSVKEVLEGNEISFYNMFIMKYDLFQEYCEWLFPILEYIENKVNGASYNLQELRFIGYVSERLFNIFVQNKVIKNNLSIKYCHTLFLNYENTTTLELKNILSKVETVSIFGTGMHAQKVLSFMKNPIQCFIDNSEEKYIFDGRPVLKPQEYHDVFQKKYPILICSSYYEEIARQLSLMGYEKNKDYFKLDTSYFL